MRRDRRVATASATPISSNALVAGSGTRLTAPTVVTVSPAALVAVAMKDAMSSEPANPLKTSEYTPSA